MVQFPNVRRVLVAFPLLSIASMASAWLLSAFVPDATVYVDSGRVTFDATSFWKSEPVVFPCALPPSVFECPDHEVILESFVFERFPELAWLECPPDTAWLPCRFMLNVPQL